MSEVQAFDSGWFLVAREDGTYELLQPGRTVASVRLGRPLDEVPDHLIPAIDLALGDL